ncbi:MAG: ABC transporter ATP-binding protein [Prolixibacteraceae bacterium]|nr:ABC transporter ATP-binding protein [Prolixibacteraceae bacterium]
MKIIEIKNLKKTYDGDSVPVHAVNCVDLSIERGEFTAIVGPSGSGKTTLLNIVGGLDDATEGAVFINGVDISSLSSGRLTDFRMNNIGFVFQAYNLIPVLTARENVEFIMHLQGSAKEHRNRRAEELLRAVGLENMMDRRPAKLSGGQQQRVAVARALASKPQFVLADEPTANLDSKSTENLLDIMEQLNKEEKITFIFSTHDQRVMNKARRVITLEDGKVVSDINKN